MTSQQDLMPSTSSKRARRSGIDVLGNLPQGTHFCQFYQTEEELLDVVLPYLRAGLEDDEYCIWITSGLLGEGEALNCMKAAVPDFHRYHARGQIEILPHNVWYLEDGSFNLGGVLDGQGHRAAQVLSSGYDSVRVAINVSWLSKKSWNKFMAYEAESNKSIAGRPVLSLCSYPLAKRSLAELLDSVKNHQFALFKRQDKWHVLGWLELQASDAIPGVTGDQLSAPTTAPRDQEEEMRNELEERLEVIFELAPDAYYLNSLEGTFIDGNKASEELTGYRRDELIGKNFLELDLLSVDQIEKAAKLLAQNAQGLPSGPDEFVLTRKDGTKVSVEIRTAPMRIKGQEMVMGIARDITERKKAENTLRASEARYRLLAENLSDMIWVMDAATMKYTYISPSVERLRGYTVSEAMTQTLEETMKAQSLESAMSALAEEDTKERSGRYDPNRTVSLEAEVTCKDGSTIWVENKVSYLRDAKGKITAYLGVSRDITERKSLMESLRTSETKYRLLAENMNETILVTDMDLRPVYTSPSFQRLTGYNAEEAMSRGMAESLTPASLKAAVEAFERAFATSGADGLEALASRPLELEMIRKDGSTVWVSTTLSLVRDDEGRVFQIMGVLHDITARRETRHALQNSEARYRLLAENVSDVIWVTDLNLRPTYMSPSVEGLLGYTVEESMERGIMESLTPNSLEVARRAFGQAMTIQKVTENDNPRSQALDLEFIRKDGSTVWASTRVSFVHDQQHHFTGIMGVLHDITERRRAAEGLRVSEERFRGLVESSSDVIWETDRRGRCSYISREASALLGYTCEELLSKNLLDLIPDHNTRMQFARNVWAKARRREPFRSAQCLISSKDGHTAVVETSGVPILDGRARVSGYRGVTRDITERHEAKKRLEESLDKLRRTMDGTILAVTELVERRDPFTAGHQRRVAGLACAMAQEMGFSPERIQVIRIAGLLHDIGKVALPTEIIAKPGPLTDLEMALIRTHCEIAYGILKSVEFPWPIADIVLQHHERIDGSGYPSGISEEDGLLIEAQILGVADVVEAMTAHRPYRKAPGIDMALEEISKNCGRLYNTEAVFACLRLFTEKGYRFADDGGNSSSI